MVEKPPKNAHICKILEVPDFFLEKPSREFRALVVRNFHAKQAAIDVDLRNQSPKVERCAMS